MKIWEETWVAATDYDSVHIEGDDEDRLDMRKGKGDALGRCKLAAAAPEMARVLLGIVERAEGDRLTSDLGEELGRELRLAIVDALMKADVELPAMDPESDWAKRAALQKAGVR